MTAGDQPEPRREPYCPCGGHCHHAESPCSIGCWAAQKSWRVEEAVALVAPTPEAAGLLPDEDEPYRDRPDSDLTIGEVNVRAGWRMAREQVRSATPSQADRGLDAATIRAAIEEACPLTNPRLSEVDWDAVAVALGSQRATEPLP